MDRCRQNSNQVQDEKITLFKQPLSTLAFKFHPQIEFAVPDVLMIVKFLTNELYSQPILDNFYCTCAETAVCQSPVKKYDPKFEFAACDVLVNVKNFQLEERLKPLLAIYLLHMRRKRPLYYLW